MDSPTAIITGDMHLRDTAPQCYTGDYWEDQAECVRFICDLQAKYGDIPIFDAGDLFNTWKSSPYLEAWAINNLPNNIVTVPGNHEMPSHNINLLEKSSLYVLDAANKIEILNDLDGTFGGDIAIPLYYVYGFGWLQEMTKPKSNKEYKRTIALAHTLVYQDEPLWAEADGGGKIVMTKAKTLLKKFSEYDLIITGHNHMGFIEEYQGRVLINPGSMMRMFADQIDYKPRVYLWHVENNHVESVYLPLKQDVVSRIHIEKKEERDKRFNAFIERINRDYEVELSFEQNMEKFLNNNKVRFPVKDIIYRAMDGDI